MNNPSTTLSPPAVIRRAWIRWSLLVTLSVVGMIAVLPFVGLTQINVKAWFIAPVLWLFLAVPATIGVYGQCFRDDWGKGGDTQTASGSEEYLRGVTSVWSVLAVGVGLSLAACLLTGSASPGIWPGALMLMLLVLARPASGPGLV